LKYQKDNHLYSASAYVIYSPEDKTAPSPIPPLKQQDITSTYYYVYNYQHFIDLVNNALLRAWQQMIALLGSLGGYWNATVAPFLDIDSSRQIVILHADKELFESGIGPLDLYFNTRLFQLFVGLPHEYASKTSDMNYRMIFVNRSDANILTRPTYYTNPSTLLTISDPTTLIQAEQEISSMALWSPVASIVFASTMLPVLPTQTSLPKELGNNSNYLTSGGNNCNLTNILSDFSIAVDINNQYRPIVEYNPGAEYRLLDMNSSINLNRVDIVVYWKDHFGNLNPFELQPGCSAHVKILFRKKDFNITN
jgi:hypothetical protein